MIKDYYDYQSAMRESLRTPPERRAVPGVGGIQRAYGESLAQKATEYQQQQFKEKQEMTSLMQDRKDLERFAQANTIANLVGVGNIGITVAGKLSDMKNMDRRGTGQTLKIYEGMRDKYRQDASGSAYEAMKTAAAEQEKQRQAYEAWLRETGQDTMEMP